MTTEAQVPERTWADLMDDLLNESFMDRFGGNPRRTSHVTAAAPPDHVAELGCGARPVPGAKREDRDSR